MIDTRECHLPEDEIAAIERQPPRPCPDPAAFVAANGGLVERIGKRLRLTPTGATLELGEVTLCRPAPFDVRTTLTLQRRFWLTRAGRLGVLLGMVRSEAAAGKTPWWDGETLGPPPKGGPAAHVRRAEALLFEARDRAESLRLRLRDC